MDSVAPASVLNMRTDRADRGNRTRVRTTHITSTSHSQNVSRFRVGVKELLCSFTWFVLSHSYADWIAASEAGTPDHEHKRHAMAFGRNKERKGPSSKKRGEGPEGSKWGERKTRVLSGAAEPRRDTKFGLINLCDSNVGPVVGA